MTPVPVVVAYLAGSIGDRVHSEFFRVLIHMFCAGQTKTANPHLSLAWICLRGIPACKVDFSYLHLVESSEDVNIWL